MPQFQARPFKIFFALALPAVLALAGCTGPTTDDEVVDLPDTADFSLTFDRPVLEQLSERVRNFGVTYGCSQENPRMVVARINWNTDTEIVGRQRVDVTVYKDGFENQYFVGLAMGAPDAGFRHARPDENLSQQTYAGSLGLRVDSVQVQRETGRVQLRVVDLNPQTNYRWRVLTLSDEGWRPSETIQKAPTTCVSDMVEG